MSEFPIATLLLILTTTTVSLSGFSSPALVGRLAFEVGPILRRGQTERLLTSSFVHADAGHLLMNMFTLFVFGPDLEYRYGPVNFVCLYIFCAIASDLAVLLLRRQQLHYSAIGASDAVCGIVGAFCVLYPFDKIYVMFLPVGIPAIVYAVLYLAWSSWQSTTQRGNIAHDAHIAGTLAGALAVLIASSNLVAGI